MTRAFDDIHFNELFDFFRCLFDQNKSGTGMVHRYCSSGTFSKGVPIESFKCTITTYFSTGNSPNTTQFDTAEVCQPCTDADGCNGTSQYGPVAAVITVSMVIMRMLTF